MEGRYRDLTIVDLGDKYLLSAVDTCGGIGMKEGDALKVDPFYVGSFTARVVIMELLSAGAEIKSLMAGSCNEFIPTGQRMLEGIKAEMDKAGLERCIIGGSSETNMQTVMSALSITAIGVLGKEGCRLGKNLDGHSIGLVGLPKVGDEINLDSDPDICTYSDIKRLLDDKRVSEMIPVGSGGIIGELDQLAVNTDIQHTDEFTKSAGPATCILVFYKGEIEGMRKIGEVV